MNGTRAQTKKLLDTVALVGLLIAGDGDETAALDGDWNAI
jgi:hypothetical protein